MFVEHPRNFAALTVLLHFIAGLSMSAVVSKTSSEEHQLSDWQKTHKFVCGKPKTSSQVGDQGI